MWVWISQVYYLLIFTVSSNQEAVDVSCSLCHLKFGSRSNLVQHLRSKSHQYEEKMVMEKLEGHPSPVL